MGGWTTLGFEIVLRPVPLSPELAAALTGISDIQALVRSGSLPLQRLLRKAPSGVSAFASRAGNYTWKA